MLPRFIEYANEDGGRCSSSSYRYKHPVAHLKHTVQYYHATTYIEYANEDGGRCSLSVDTWTNGIAEDQEKEEEKVGEGSSDWEVQRGRQEQYGG